MAKGQGTPPSRWGQPERDQPAPGKPAWNTARWGQPEASKPAPPDPEPINFPRSAPTEEQRPATAEPQEPLQLKAVPAAPSASFPLPRPQANKAEGQARQQQSYTWLKNLEGADGKKAGTRRVARRTRRSRRKLIARGLLALLSLLLVAAILTVSIPGLRERALALLPQGAASPEVSTAEGVLIAQSNVPNSTLVFQGQTYQLVIKNQAFWSIQLAAISPGTYSLSISAPHYTTATGRVQIKAQQQRVVTAFLSLDPAYLASLLSTDQNQISGQTLANPVAVGAQYTGTSTASAALKVTISYRVVSLVKTPAPSVLEIDQTSPPSTGPLSGVVTPDILFTNAATGAMVSEYRPNALPVAHFLVALIVTFDATGKGHFGLGDPAALTATIPSGAALVVPGRITPDLALLFALVQIALEQGAAGGHFTCIGEVDALAHPGANADPEDGLLLGVPGSSAHFFYRWGQFWTTNAFAHALTPALPQANQDTLVLAQSLIDAGNQGQPTGCA